MATSNLEQLFRGLPREEPKRSTVWQHGPPSLTPMKVISVPQHTKRGHRNTLPLRHLTQQPPEAWSAAAYHRRKAMRLLWSPCSVSKEQVMQLRLWLQVKEDELEHTQAAALNLLHMLWIYLHLCGWCTFQASSQEQDDYSSNVCTNRILALHYYFKCWYKNFHYT